MDGTSILILLQQRVSVGYDRIPTTGPYPDVVCTRIGKLLCCDFANLSGRCTRTDSRNHNTPHFTATRAHKHRNSWVGSYIPRYRKVNVPMCHFTLTELQTNHATRRHAQHFRASFSRAKKIDRAP